VDWIVEVIRLLEVEAEREVGLAKVRLSRIFPDIKVPDMPTSVNPYMLDAERLADDVGAVMISTKSHRYTHPSRALAAS
jgi:hypothetical protein